MKTTRWALLLSALLGTLANGAEVYRSTDANGVPTFTDRPNENSVPVFVATPRPGRAGSTATARPAVPPAGANAATPGTQQAANSSGDGEQRPQQTPAERAAERAKNCTIARERVDKYAVAHRLYRDTGNGQREYLTDGEIDEAKARAAADVATWCG